MRHGEHQQQARAECRSDAPPDRDGHGDRRDDESTPATQERADAQGEAGTDPRRQRADAHDSPARPPGRPRGSADEEKDQQGTDQQAEAVRPVGDERHRDGRVAP
ncbi:MAG: hypothetical protein ABWX74_06600, partial [Aeromicrobium sp.]